MTGTVKIRTRKKFLALGEAWSVAHVFVCFSHVSLTDLLPSRHEGSPQLLTQQHLGGHPGIKSLAFEQQY